MGTSSPAPLSGPHRWSIGPPGSRTGSKSVVMPSQSPCSIRPTGGPASIPSRSTDRVERLRARTRVVGIALQDDVLLVVAVYDVVRARGRYVEPARHAGTPRAARHRERTASPVGTGQKKGSASRCRKSPDGARRARSRACHRSRGARRCGRRRRRGRHAPPRCRRHTSSPGLRRPSLGESARSIERRNVSAVTDSFSGGEKAKPLRTVNEYVRPSAETVGIASATSGRSSQPAGAGSSG